MPSISRPKPIPTDGVNVGDVAAATSSQMKSMGQATAQGAGMTGARQLATARATVASTATFVDGDTTGGAFTLTLPPVAQYSRNFWFVTRISGANVLTLAAASGNTVNGAASIAVTNMVIVRATSNTAWTATQIG